MIADERLEHGVSHRFAGLLDALLDVDDAAIPKQTVHARKRGRHGSRCGASDGQISPMGIGVTCPACLAKGRR